MGCNAARGSRVRFVGVSVICSLFLGDDDSSTARISRPKVTHGHGGAEAAAPIDGAEKWSWAERRTAGCPGLAGGFAEKARLELGRGIARRVRATKACGRI